MLILHAIPFSFNQFFIQQKIHSLYINKIHINWLTISILFHLSHKFIKFNIPAILNDT